VVEVAVDGAVVMREGACEDVEGKIKACGGGAEVREGMMLSVDDPALMPASVAALTASALAVERGEVEMAGEVSVSVIRSESAGAEGV
jgi:hypothetical protein